MRGYDGKSNSYTEIVGFYLSIKMNSTKSFNHNTTVIDNQKVESTDEPLRKGQR